MLAFLQIKNLAIADDISLDLSSGFTVLTGETGAGKSIIVDAISLLSGARAYRELIRTGEEQAKVEGIFENLSPEVKKKMAELGFEPDNSLTVKRVILKNGKNRIFINGEVATLSQLESIGKMLVEIHSQNDQLQLLNTENHLNYLDTFGNYGELLEKVKSAYQKVVKEREVLKKLSISEEEKNQKIDILKFQIKEIEEADLKEGEIESLLEKKRMLKNTEKIKQSVMEAGEILNGETSLFEKLSALLSSVSVLSEYKENFGTYREEIQSFLNSLKEMDLELSELAVSLEEEDMNLDQIENRLYQIEKLQKKYGKTYNEITDFLKKAKEELSSLEELDFKLREQKKRVVDAVKQYLEYAVKLSEERKKTAALFGKSLKKELKQLAMKNIEIKFDLKTKPLPSNEEEILSFIAEPLGIDGGEILISPNVGEDLKPLAKIASGGELSRIMLAVKVLINDTAGKLTVFDEIDTGIGGETAFYIGEKLKKLSKDRQVVCVTHLAQIAARADNHFYIEKIVFEGRTKTVVKLLKRDDRVKEIARMIGGEKITDASLKHARELLGGING